MYRYDNYDKQMVQERVAQFRLQTKRYLAGKLTDEQFRPLRLMNGLYIQRHAPMLRIAIPYGLLSPHQLRKLAYITRTYDKGSAHFTTRQNLQLNWPKIEDVPDILAHLAEVEMHAIQTSGNCIRNITADHLAGVSPDELVDPRIYSEIIRQWSTFHPEFSFLPRKFKIAVSGAEYDRAATQVHDIGVYLRRNDKGEMGCEILVGGGLGRTPVIGKVIQDFLPRQYLLSYLEAIMRVYNEEGRRDNIYKARIKILVNALGIDEFRRRVDEEWLKLKELPELRLKEETITSISEFFTPPSYDAKAGVEDEIPQQKHKDNAEFMKWFTQNTTAHKVAGYRIIYLSLKHPAQPPGDLTADQMEQVADLADSYSFGEIRVVHTQNLVFADVRNKDVYELWRELDKINLATPNIGTLTDVICCPGLDYCSLANAGTIEIADQINNVFEDLDYLYDLGELRVNISGCMNACGHHHVGHIGLLGVEKKGEEWYQIQLGGNSGVDASIGKVLGAAVPKKEVAAAIGKLLTVYKEKREEEETFLQTYRRIGMAPFKEQLYGPAH